MLFNSTGSYIDANVSGIAESCVLVYQTAPIYHIHAATSSCINLLLLFLCIADGDIPLRRREVATMDPQDTFGEPGVRSTPLPFVLHATWARYARINNKWDQLEYQTAGREQSSGEHLYRLKIERVCLVNSRRVQAAFVANQQGSLQVLSFLPCNYFSLANCLKVCFIDVHAR